MKKLLVLVSAIFIFLLLPPPVLAKSFFFPKVEININLNSDRSADFVERRTTSFSGSFSQLYWDIPLTSEQAVTNVSVNGFEEIPYEDMGRPANKFFTRREGNSEHIEAYYTASDETITFILSYHLTNAVIKHPDAGEFYWKIIGENWGTKTDLVTATVVLPVDVGKEKIHVWAHGPLNGQSTIVDGKTTRLTVSDVPPETFVEVRETFPSTILSGENTGNKSFTSIEAEEEGFRQETIRKERIRLGTFLAIVLGAAGWIFYWYRIWDKHGKEYAVEVPKYVHFPPSKRPPALVEALLNQEQSVSVNSFTATLLDLAARKFVKIEARESYSKGILGIGSKKQYSYILHRISRNSEEKLYDFERELLDFIFEMAPDELTVPFDIVKERMKSSPTTTKKFFDGRKKKLEKPPD